MLSSIRFMLSPYCKAMSGLAAPHYLLNTIACIVYVFTRVIEPVCQTLYPGEECKLDQRDLEIILFISFILVVKNRRWKALDTKEVVSKFFMFGKCANLLLFLRMDPRWAAFYFVYCLLLFLVFPEPSYKGPENVNYFRGQALEEELDRDKKVVWVIEFYAGWSPSCVHFAEVFASLSLKYGHDFLRFGKLDTGRYPGVAKRFKVDNSVSSKQLPTVILFENGKEKIRRPEIDTIGTVGVYKFLEKNVIRDYNLNEYAKQSQEKLVERQKQEKKNKKSKEKIN